MIVFLNHPDRKALIILIHPLFFFVSWKTSDIAQKAKFISQTTREHLVLVLQLEQCFSCIGRHNHHLLGAKTRL